MIIDFHCHSFPDAMAARAMATMMGSEPHPTSTDGSYSGLRASMKEAGIDYSVVLPVATNPLKLTTMNDDAIAHDPSDGLIFFGGMHPAAPNWKEELDRLAAGGVKGIKLHPGYQRTPMDDPSYLAIMEHCAKLGLIVVAHCGHVTPGPHAERSTPERTARAIRALKGTGLRFVAAHLGGCKTYEDVMKHYADVDCYFDLSEILTYPVYQTPHYIFVSPKDVVRLVRELGVERFLFASDLPWFSQKGMVDAAMYYPFTEEERAAILGGNAQKLLGL